MQPEATTTVEEEADQSDQLGDGEQSNDEGMATHEISDLIDEQEQPDADDDDDLRPFRRYLDEPQATDDAQTDSPDDAAEQ